MKKVILGILVIIIIAISVATFAFYNYYKKSLVAVGSSDEKVTITINEGSTSRQIIDKLYEANLLKDKKMAYLYIKLNPSNNLQAGTYELNRGMSLEEIIKKIGSGEAFFDTIKVTFVEGKRITNYAKTIHDSFGYSEDEIIKTLQDQEYIQELINKYWFLTEEVQNDKLYYALEGYLYPDTYEFTKDATIKQIIEKMLDKTSIVLSQYKTAIEESDLTLHEILTMASIIELEGASSSDRAGVAGVFYNRYYGGWSLGSDVTTYYAAKIEMSDRDLYQYELDDENDYNTRSSSMAGRLPVGPICSPGEDAIKAAINPTKHNYYYFVADKNKKTYFSSTLSEHNATINYLQSNGLWYTYE